MLLSAPVQGPMVSYRKSVTPWETSRCTYPLTCVLLPHCLRRRTAQTERVRFFQIDSIDPAFAPATGTPETGGWSTRELRTILRGLDGLHIVSADIVEVAPDYDSQGTSLPASRNLLLRCPF